MTRSTLFFFIFSAAAFSCTAQCDTCNIQEVLLVGTLHKTSPERVKEVIPVAEAIRRFSPGVICVEYPIPGDTSSLIWRGGDRIFEDAERKRKAWNVSPNHAERINSLQRYLHEHPSDYQKRIQLQQHYCLSHDLGNADYQGYLVFKQIVRDSETESVLKEAFAGYETLRSPYERGRWLNNEYHILVFPLAETLNIHYLHPIDDASTWTSYEKHYERLQIRDDSDSIKVGYHERIDAFQKMIAELPLDTNQYILSNSAAFTELLINIEGYEIDSDSFNHDLKMKHRYWVLRNKTMAQHIDKVARDNPEKDVAVFFGASHVGSVREELKKLHTNYQVLTLPDILK